MTAQTTSPATDIDHIPALRIPNRGRPIIREVVAELENRCCCSPAARIRSSCCTLRRRHSDRTRCRSPILHVDTGHNFSEVIAFRDKRVTPTAQRPDGVRLIVASVQESIDTGRVEETTDPSGSRNRLQTRTLLDALERYKFDAAFGGARRDEDRARAKERVFSFRDEFGQWDPRAQRAEPWSLYNGRIRRGESVRVFPLSNWTELDIWRYIELEDIELPPIYFASQRDVFTRDGILLTVSPFTHPRPDEPVTTEWVRYRTVGDLTITGLCGPPRRRCPR